MKEIQYGTDSDGHPIRAVAGSYVGIIHTTMSTNIKMKQHIWSTIILSVLFSFHLQQRRRHWNISFENNNVGSKDKFRKQKFCV